MAVIVGHQPSNPVFQRSTINAKKNDEEGKKKLLFAKTIGENYIHRNVCGYGNQIANQLKIENVFAAILHALSLLN